MNLLGALPSGVEQHSKRVQRISKENERSNLVAITRLLLNALLDNVVRGTRLLDADSRELADLLIILERALWHGFKTSGISILRSPDSDMWNFLKRLTETSDAVSSCWQSIAQLENLSTPSTKVRGFLRLCVLQKKAADFFQIFQRSSASTEISDYYEPWSILRQESGASFAGSLLALSVLDCNLMLDFHVLQEQETTIDISPYVKIPTVMGQFPEQLSDDRSNVERELASVLDQNCYLEERNRQLSDNLQQLKKKHESSDSAASPVFEVDKSLVFTQRVRDLEREREILQARITEKEDTVRTLQQQNIDIKRINEDLYEKLRVAETRCGRLTRDLDQLNASYKQETEELKRSLQAAESLTKTNTASEGSNAEIPSIYEELSKRTEQYMETMAILNKKQQELSSAHETIVRTEQRCKDVERQLADVRGIEQEFLTLKSAHDHDKRRLEECERALEEMGDHLSESKLKVFELREEILPLTDAEWMKDSEVSDCQSCKSPFSVTLRRHHCRNCGRIFCVTCSAARVKLPSNAKPVRVCLHCYELLRNRQSTSSDLS